MYTYLKLKNFKSFNDVEFNFKKGKNKAKKLIAIYGENGAGKTNFVLAYQLLMQEFISIEYDHFVETTNIQTPLTKFTEFLLELQMKQTDKPTEIEYGFLIDGKEGYYKIKFHDGKIIYEEMYYVINKNKGSIFKINQGNKEIEVSLCSNFIDNIKYEKEIIQKIDQYWGKYPMIGILSHERATKNKEYINEHIMNSLLQVLDNLNSTNVNVKSNHGEINKSYTPKGFLKSVESGTIKKEDEYILDKYESILNEFFVQTYSEIKHIYYQKDIQDNDITQYELFFEKQINNKIITLSFKEESKGTRSLLMKFNSLLSALEGQNVIIDEIDNGIHDLLIKDIIENIENEITGQLIITTHNTLLLETLKKENIYVIVTNYEGNKNVNCIEDYDFRIQKNNNIRNLYLKGLFGGIPFIGDIDFNIIKEELVYKENNNRR